MAGAVHDLLDPVVPLPRREEARPPILCGDQPQWETASEVHSQVIGGRGAPGDQGIPASDRDRGQAYGNKPCAYAIRRKWTMTRFASSGRERLRKTDETDPKSGTANKDFSGIQ